MRTLTFVRAMVADPILKPLVDKAIDHDGPSWRRFQELVWPGILLVAGRYSNTGRLSLDVDERRNVGVIVIARFARNGFEGLKLLQGVLGTSGDSGWRWICCVTARKARDYEKTHAENLGPDSQGMPRFVTPIPLTPEAQELLPASVRGADDADAHRIMAYAEQNLRPPQLAALRLHVIGEPDESIAEEMGLPGARDAYRLWHGAVSRLQYHFIVKGGEGHRREKK